MSLTELSVENGLCRCCLAEGDFKNLGHTFIINEEEEVYSRMLRECFGITINPVAGEYSQSTYSICEKCLKTLREANIFKKMVIESEIKFQHLLSTSFIKDLKPIKVELDEVIISADENKDDNNGGVRDTHIDDDDFRYPCSDEDDKSTLELKLELEPTSKKPKTEVKKDTQPYKTKLRKKKTTKESASVPQKKTRKGSNKDADVAEYYKAIIDEVTGEMQYFCYKCGSVLQTLWTIQTHIRNVHLRDFSICCNLCPEKFPSHRKRRTHMVHAHGLSELTDSVVGDHSCNLCQKSFRTKQALTSHYKHSHYLVSCKNCQERCTLRKMPFHMNEAHGFPIPTCGICGYKQFSEALLARHQRKVHMKEKNVSCPSCELKFFDTTDLKKHLVKHTNARNFECEFCHKKFQRRSTLTLHVKIHTGEKDKICSVCGEAFVQKASLNYHMTKHHPDVV